MEMATYIHGDIIAMDNKEFNRQHIYTKKSTNTRTNNRYSSRKQHNNSIRQKGEVLSSGYNTYGNLGNNATQTRKSFDKVIENTKQ